MAPQLRPIPGVNEVNSFGGFVKQYHVLVRPEALIKYDLGLRDVVEALERNNANAAGGFIVRGWEQTYIRGLGQIAGIEDIREVVLKVADGTPVHVHDVAEVVVGPQSRQGAVSRDGKGEAVAGMVIMLRGANSKDVVTRVKETVPADPEEPAAGRRAQRLLRPDLPDRSLHQDRRRRPARGRHLRDPGPLSLRRRAAHRADRRRLAADHLPRDVPDHGPRRDLLEPDEPRRAGVFGRHGRRRLDRHRRKHAPPLRRAARPGAAAAHRHRGDQRGGAARGVSRC